MLFRGGHLGSLSLMLCQECKYPPVPVDPHDKESGPQGGAALVTIMMKESGVGFQ